MSRWFIVGVATVFIFLTSCGGGGGGGGGASAGAGSGGGQVADRGDFRLGTFATNYVIEPTGEPAIDMNGMRQLFSDLANDLNAMLKLNKDITISSRDCGTVNAFYSPTNSEIVMCTEMYIALLSYYMRQVPDSGTAQAYALLGFLFIFGHELGHALIDNYQLPVLGKQEDAADAMSVVLWMETASSADEKAAAVGLVLLGAQFMLDLTKDSPYYGEHTPGPGRMANLVCWAGGAYPAALSNSYYANIYNTMIQSGRNCPAEYEEKRRSIEQLLGPYFKE